MDNEYLTRGYLLPDGYKDLSEDPRYHVRAAPGPAKPLPPVIGEMALPDQLTVPELAAALQQKRFWIMAHLIAMGISVTLDYVVPFDVAAKLAREYGYIAKRKV